ncbi:MAG: hypothetical protein ABIF17_00885 [Patescibacteria group bacterium]
MAELFDIEVNTVNYHLKEIFKSQELEEKSVIRKIRITASDGKKYKKNQNKKHASYFDRAVKQYFKEK